MLDHVTLRTKSLEGMLERLPLAARDVLAFATIEGARALRLDSRIGSLTPGKEADVTVLSWSHERSSPLVNPVQAVGRR